MSVSPSRIALVADIGGTNARFALTDGETRDIELIEPRALPADRFGNLLQAIECYLADTGARPRRAALALASPVDGDEIRLTNRAWSFNRRELQRQLGLDELRLLNDFGAVARAIPVLGDADRVGLWGPTELAGSPVSVFGPGTGLGVAVLVGAGDGRWQVIETEGGHAGFAPSDDEERVIAAWLQTRYGRVSIERVLCGEGLSQIAAALQEETRAGDSSRLRDPGEILGAALERSEPWACRALDRYCAILGSVAGDLSLLHGARRVVIAGGIVPRLIPFLRGSSFRERFLAKGRMSMHLEAVGVEVIVHPQPGLLGAAVALRHGAGSPGSFAH
jgi:glucokinase